MEPDFSFIKIVSNSPLNPLGYKQINETFKLLFFFKLNIKSE